jgi:hypothetical protein
MKNTLGDSEEIWKDIKGYENLYKVSNLGNVYSYLTNKILKPGKDNGYLKVNLSKNKKIKQFTVHRLVSLMFLPNNKDYPCINHKDENPSNNNVDNLEWCTHKYNNNYGSVNKRKSETLKGRNIGENHPMHGKKHTNESKMKMSEKLSKTVICTTTKEIFASGKEASLKMNINCANINGCCRGKRNSAGKHPITGEKLKWEYYRRG